jgi:glutathione S-transferase
MKLYYMPFSSYSQKVLVAFYEKGVAFTPALVAPWDPAARADYLKVNPLGKVPTLVLDDGTVIPESTTIIEYVEDHFPAGPRLLPADKDRARDTRLHDRMLDLYFNETMQTIFFDARKPPEERSPSAVASAKRTLDTLYPRYDERMATRTWMMGDDFTLADCSAAPCFAYLRMVHPYAGYKHLTAYLGRLTERPSFARVLEEAAPFIAKLVDG